MTNALYSSGDLTQILARLLEKARTTVFTVDTTDSHTLEQEAIQVGVLEPTDVERSRASIEFSEEGHRICVQVTIPYAGGTSALAYDPKHNGRRPETLKDIQYNSVQTAEHGDATVFGIRLFDADATEAAIRQWQSDWIDDLMATVNAANSLIEHHNHEVRRTVAELVRQRWGNISRIAELRKAFELQGL